MGRTCFARALVRALAALLLATQLVAGQETVAYSKFMLFFDLLDQTGAISQEFAAADGDLCQVKGVGCENGEVVTMNFSNRGLVGELIKDNYIYENLPKLRTFNFRGNNLGYGVAPIPNDLAKLTNLEYLDLSNNAFTGEMPTFTISSSSGAFQKITHIDLSNNQLRGRLRWNWGQLPPSTGYVNLSGNSLSGALPEAWYQDGGMQGIDTLDVSGNNQDICGDGGGQTQGEEAFATRGVSFSCRADGSGATVVPISAASEATPLFDQDGTPITGPNGGQIFIGSDGEPLVDAEGNSVVDATGNPVTDVNGNPVATNPDGSIKADANGTPIYVDSDGEELVAPDGTSLHGPNGQFTQDGNGNPIATGPDGKAITDSDGNPVFVGPDGEPLVTSDGDSQTGIDGQPIQDANGNPIATDANGDPVLDPDGSPVFQGPNGPLVDGNGSSIVAPDGDLATDANGNPAAIGPNGAPATDPSGAPIFVGPDGEPLVDENGASIIGPNGNITSDVDGNPVATNPDGSVKTDDNGNPVFVGDDGNPIVDEDGQSTRGWDGEPLIDDYGEEITPAVFAPNGTVIPGDSLGGDPVFDSDGKPIFDANGDPVVIPEGGKQPPANITAGGAVWKNGNDTALPNGDLAGDLQTPVCASPLPFKDPPASCYDPEALPVCLSPDQLVLNATALAQNGTLPPNLYGCDANVTSETFFHQFFPGETVQGANAREEDTLARMKSVVSGDKPVSVVSWTAVYGSADSTPPAPAPEPPAAAPTVATMAGANVNAMAAAALVDDAPQRRLLARLDVSAMPLAAPQRYSLTAMGTGAGAAQRVLQQVQGQDPIGVMGYFLVTGGTLEDLQALVSEFSGVGQTIGEDGTPILTQRQTSELPECGGTNTARTVLLSTLAVCIGVLLAGLVITSYTIARLRRRPHHTRGDTTGMVDGGSNTTITPSGTGRGPWSDHELVAMSPNTSGQRLPSGTNSPAAASGSAGSADRGGVLPGGFGSYSGKMAAAGSFGSYMGATGRLGEDSDSPRSSSRENDGASQNVLTLKDGMGGRKPSGQLQSGSWTGEQLPAGAREGSLPGPLSQDSDGGLAAPLSAADHNRSDSSGNSTGSGNTGEVPGAGNSYAFTSANVAAAGNGNGNGNGNAPRTQMEPDFVSVNGPLTPIAEHVAHSEMNTNSETNSSMGDGSRMGGSSTAGISPTVPGAGRTGSGSTLNPAVRSNAMGDSVAAESSLLDPTSASLASQQGDSSAVLPAAAAVVGTAGAAAVAMASTAPGSKEEESPEHFHTFSVDSWDEAHKEGGSLADESGQVAVHPTSDQMNTNHSSSAPSAAGASPGSGAAGSVSEAATTSSNSPPPSTFGAAAYPMLTPTATGPGGTTQGTSGALEQNLVSITQLGSIGIGGSIGMDQNSRGSNATEDTSAHGVLPSSTSSADEKDGNEQNRTDPTGQSTADGAGLFPGASSSWMFGSRGDGVMERMSPDAHVETQHFTSTSMLDSLQHSTMGGRLQPTVEEPYEVEEEDGDVEVTHAEHNVMMGETGPNPSDIGVDGGSLPHLSAVPFNPLLENSASMGIGGDNSQMQSSSNPRAPGPSGVLRQAYDLVDSMGQVADHTVVPSDHLDTGVMISVPQQPAHGSPGSSAQNLDFVAAAYSPTRQVDSHGPGPQMPAPSGMSDDNPAPDNLPSIMSSEEATGRLEVPTSLEEMMASHEESQFRSIDSHALYASRGNSAHSHHSYQPYRSTQE